MQERNQVNVEDEFIFNDKTISVISYIMLYKCNRLQEDVALLSRNRLGTKRAICTRQCSRQAFGELRPGVDENWRPVSASITAADVLSLDPCFGRLRWVDFASARQHDCLSDAVAAPVIGSRCSERQLDSVETSRRLPGWREENTATWRCSQ